MFTVTSQDTLQAYRSHLSEGLVDGVRWNGSSVMRRQVSSTDFV